MQITDYPGFLKIVPGMSLTALVSALFKFLLIIAGLAALIMIVWGGVKYLTSAGDPSKTKDAKKQVFAAILGLIILFSSWLILGSINPNLTNIQEPTAIPAPIVTPPSPPTEPTAPSPAAFFYIPLGQIINDVVSQEKETIPKMREFANSAAECNRDYCAGGTCEYWVSEECPEEEPLPEPPKEEPPWWQFWMITPPVVNAKDDCGSWATCSASCNAGDPCSAGKSEAINRVLAAADRMDEEISKLQQAKSKIENCILQEDTVLLSCQEALDTSNPEGEVKNCRQGYNFYCMYGSDNDAYFDEMILPFETIKESIESVKELERVVSSCNCSGASFSCGGCSGSCGGTPCPSQAYSALASAMEAVNKLETQLKKLEETIAEITLMSAADEIITLTCSEAYSWLKSIKGSGCPGAKIFPCCPVDQETEKTIRSCKSVDFFFCSAP